MKRKTLFAGLGALAIVIVTAISFAIAADKKDKGVKAMDPECPSTPVCPCPEPR